MKNLIPKYKYLILFVATLAGCFGYLSLPISNVVHAQSYGVVANDGIDDTAAINAAITALQARGGGKLVFPEGQIIVSDRLYFNTYQNFVSYDIEGDGTEILVNGDASKIIFYFGNNNRVTIDGLTFVGRNVQPGHAQFVDCGYLIFANYVEKLVITNSSFIGIRADISIVYSGRADTVIENSTFGGSSGGSASVEVGTTVATAESIFYGLTVKNTNFLDYGNYRQNSYWKSSTFNPAWIKVDASPAIRDFVNAMGQKLLRIEDCRFDEAATIAIALSNVAHVKIEGINVNVNGADGARAIDFSGVGFAEVTHSRFGYAIYPRPALRAVNNSKVEAKGISTGNGVFFGVSDATSSIERTACRGNCQLQPAQ